MNKEKLLNKWRKSGRLAFEQPRNKKISLNGGPYMPEKEQLERIAAFFGSATPCGRKRACSECEYMSSCY